MLAWGALYTLLLLPILYLFICVQARLEEDQMLASKFGKVSYFRALRELNPDSSARLHLDSNGTLLTPDYVDELVDVGVTDIGVEPKGVRPETFMRIRESEERAICVRALRRLR